MKALSARLLLLCLALAAASPCRADLTPPPALPTAEDSSPSPARGGQAAPSKAAPTEGPGSGFPNWEAYSRSLEPLHWISKSESHTLRVLYLDDPRLPGLLDSERQALYRKVEKLLKAWFGFTVAVRETGYQPLKAYFDSAADMFERPKNATFIATQELDMSHPESKEQLEKVVANAVANLGLRTIRRYMDLPEEARKKDAVREAAGFFARRLKQLQNIRVRGGGRFYDKAYARTQSYPHWIALASELKNADFLLTNSAIVGADMTMPIYVIARGGLTTGLVTNNALSPFRAVGMVGLLPFLSDAEVFLRDRGDIPISQRLDVMATFWMHELGHYFLRYAEAYGEAGCVHVAPEGLTYYSWHKAVRAKDGRCTLKPKRVQHY